MLESLLPGLFALCAILYIALAVHALRTPQGRLFGSFLLLLGMILAGPAVFFGTDDALRYGVGRVFTFIGSGFLPVVFFLLYRQYTDVQVRPWMIALMCIIPVSTLGLAITNPMHEMIWMAYSTPEGQAFTDVNEHLWFKAVFAPYCYGLFAYTWIALASRVGGIAPAHARVISIILVGAVLPFVVSFSNTLLGFGPIDFPFTALTISILLPVYAYASLTLRLADFSALGYRSLFNHVRDPIIVLDKELRILCANASASKMLGKPEKEMLGNLLWEDLPDAQDLLQNGKGLDMTQTLKLTEDLIYEVSIAPLRDARGHEQGTVVMCRDVTQRRRTLGQLAENEHLIRTLIETSSNGILRFAKDELSETSEYRCIFANPAAERFLSPASGSLVGSELQSLKILQPEKLAGHFSRPRKNHSQTTYEFSLEGESGDNIWLRITAEPVGMDFSVTIVDITKRKRDEDQMMQQALLDPLTGVLNRRGFEAEAKSRLSGCEQAGIIYLDLNSFKQVNDSFGHQAGDALLKAFGHRLSYCLRPEDVLGRLGGDEFAIVLPGLALEDLEHVIERVKATGREAYIIKGQEIRCSVSIGHALMPEHGEELWHLISVADESMYANKSTKDTLELRQMKTQQ